MVSKAEDTFETRPDAAERASVRFGSRARLGLLVPSGNTVAEGDFDALLPSNISFHATRLRLTGSSPEELLAMVDNVEMAASLLADTKPDLIGFHCTAVSTSSEELETSILERARAASGIDIVVTSQAISRAMSVLNAKRVVLVTPYVDHINQSEIEFLHRQGVEVVDSVGLDLFSPHEMAAVTPEAWFELTVAHRHGEADAYFISCTAIRSLDVIAPLEGRLERPVITSNQAMAWHVLRTMGVSDRIAGYGRLMNDY
ncbi:arylmalonate decarboxylase [Amorphus sp. 3PC139-8]|uniref:maleate cis-trans isomerase family protein n=1 Tax=Amorphus sp. 3PC139-8 TaxID=2735676 RepID=UPI00345DDAAD